MRVLQVVAEWMASFLEVALYLFLMGAVSEERSKGRKRAVSFAAVVTVVGAGVILLNMAEVSVSLATLVYAVFSYALGACILYRGRFLEYLLASVGFVSALLLADTAVLAVLGRIGMGEVVAGVLSGQGVYRLAVLGLIKAFEAGAVFLLCGVARRTFYRLRVSGGYAAAVVCLLLGGFGGVWLVNQAEALVGVKLNLFEMLLGICLVLGLCMGYFALWIREMGREREYAVRQRRILEQNYRMARESYEANAVLYHDMRNHFGMVQGYLAEGEVSEAREYLERVSGWLEAYPREQWTGIGALDYILNQKKAVADRQGTRMEIHAEYPRDCRIDPVDLCTILTNLLDNALEACAGQGEGEPREIDVTIRRINLFLILRIANSSAGEAVRAGGGAVGTRRGESLGDVRRNGKLVSSKRNGHMHGWGLRSVRAAVEKYQGTMEFDCRDGVFTVSVMLFYDRNSDN